MITLLLACRVMAWIGEQKSGLMVSEEGGDGGWRDKRAAGSGGCGAQISSSSSAIHNFYRLAVSRSNGAIEPFRQPSLLRSPSHQ